jgi:1,4-alpha-glucan branching enzyme
MLKKSYSKSGKQCRVTFSLPREVNAENVALCGDFNGWDNNDHIMKKLKDGSFSLTISLPAGRSYRFRYLLDGERWENDWAADAYLPNSYGSEDSVVVV